MLRPSLSSVGGAAEALKQGGATGGMSGRLNATISADGFPQPEPFKENELLLCLRGRPIKRWVLLFSKVFSQHPPGDRNSLGLVVPIQACANQPAERPRATHGPARKNISRFTKMKGSGRGSQSELYLEHRFLAAVQGLSTKSPG